MATLQGARHLLLTVLPAGNQPHGEDNHYFPINQLAAQARKSLITAAVAPARQHKYS
jgi:hypothetical protein